MKYPTRVFYTETQKSEMWDRWSGGEALNSIARHFGCGHSSIQRVFARTRGIRPALRHRSRLALSLGEREEISRGVVAGYSLRTKNTGTVYSIDFDLIGRLVRKTIINR